MKKKSIKAVFVSIIFGLLLSACNATAQSDSKSSDSINPVDPYQNRIKRKDFKIINIAYELQNISDPRYYENSKPLANYLKQDTYALYYLDQVDDVYYLPLSTYVDLFKGDFKDGVVNTITENNGVSTWTSTFDKKTFTLSLDKNEQTLSVKGSVEEFFKPIPNGRNGVFDYAKIETSYVEGHEEKMKTFSFKKYGFDVFDVDGKTCFPFALIAAEISKYTEHKFANVSFYNYLVEYVSSAQYLSLSYLNDKNEEVLFDSLIKSSYTGLYSVENKDGYKEIVAPKTLTEFNKKIIYYLFDNYYGLASTKGIKSMSTYFENLEESSEGFTSSNGGVRGSAYARAIQGLNDLHSSYGYSSFLNEGADSNAICEQSLYKDRMALATLLGTLREQELTKYNEARGTSVTDYEVRYSEDGKYAYFSFDLFDTFTYYEQGDIPKETLFSDCYYQFVKNLNEIKAKNTVKRVFIDDTRNGGGYVALMGKLLALLSKDNKSVMYLCDKTDNSIQALTTRVDSNKDGVYDEKDCFGNDFEFFIITSSYSFSCGNAFPFYADENGFAKIIGTQSGGGECCVFNYVLPTGQSITYSSPYHIGQYHKTEDKFVGDEKGAYPWLPLSHNYSMYNVDTLGSFVTQAKPFTD